MSKSDKNKNDNKTRSSGTPPDDLLQHILNSKTTELDDIILQLLGTGKMKDDDEFFTVSDINVEQFTLDEILVMIKETLQITYDTSNNVVNISFKGVDANKFNKQIQQKLTAGAVTDKL
jgi:hypothetical protein